MHLLGGASPSRGCGPSRARSAPGWRGEWSRPPYAGLSGSWTSGGFKRANHRVWTPFGSSPLKCASSSISSPTHFTRTRRARPPGGGPAEWPARGAPSFSGRRRVVLQGTLSWVGNNVCDGEWDASRGGGGRCRDHRHPGKACRARNLSGSESARGGASRPHPARPFSDRPERDPGTRAGKGGPRRANRPGFRYGRDQLSKMNRNGSMRGPGSPPCVWPSVWYAPTMNHWAMVGSSNRQPS